MNGQIELKIKERIDDIDRKYYSISFLTGNYDRDDVLLDDVHVYLFERLMKSPSKVYFQMNYETMGITFKHFKCSRIRNFSLFLEGSFEDYLVFFDNNHGKTFGDYLFLIPDDSKFTFYDFTDKFLELEQKRTHSSINSFISIFKKKKIKNEYFNWNQVSSNYYEFLLEAQMFYSTNFPLLGVDYRLK